MSVFGAAGSSAVERLEQRLGPRVALRSYEVLLSQFDSQGPVAAWGMWRCAWALRDEAARRRLLEEHWPRLQGEQIAGVVAEAKALCRRHEHAWAEALVTAEAQRSNRARAWYLLGRIRQLRGLMSPAQEAFERAGRATDADRDGRRAADAAHRAWLTQRLREGLDVPVYASDGSPSSTLLAAMTELVQRGDEARLRGLERLTRLARWSAVEGPADAVETGRAALYVAAWFADRRGPRLTEGEYEHLRTILEGAPDPKRREMALERLAARRANASHRGRDSEVFAVLRAVDGGSRHLDLARALVDGVELDHETVGDQGHVPEGVAGAMQVINDLQGEPRGGDARVRQGLFRLAELASAPGSPAAIWTAATSATAAGYRQGLSLLVTLIQTGESPPRGFYWPAAAAHRAGHPRLADTWLRRAVAEGEPEALAQLQRRLLIRAWSAFREGRDDEALAALREAKAIEAKRS